MKKFISMASICMMAVLFISCEKGDVGPQGPQGPQGDKGDPSNPGISARTVKVYASEWSNYVNPTGGSMVACQKSVPEITSSIVSKGAVMVYLRQPYNGGGYYYQAMPFTWVINSNNSRTYSFSISTSLLNLSIEETDNSLGSFGTHTFKVVIIDGSTKMANPNVDLNNYEEVKAAFHLTD